MSQSRRLPGTPSPQAAATRVVATESRHLDLGIVRKGGPIAFIAKAPDYPREGVLEFAFSSYGVGVNKYATGSKPPSAIPLWRSTTMRWVVAASGRKEMVNDSKRDANTDRKGTILRFDAAVIVLPILWRFGCCEAAKLGYGA